MLSISHFSDIGVNSHEPVIFLMVCVEVTHGDGGREVKSGSGVARNRKYVTI